ncbi:MAG: YifB family Mg chelatase-like AAA ATPase [Burkholderiaceae bacterium]
MSNRLARIRSQALLGTTSPRVDVEVHLANGLPAFNIVGLPNAAVRESRDRVRAAITQSGFDFPNRRLTVNLAPADLPKDSGRFDLPIAIGILIATGQIENADRLRDRIFIGELSLNGALRPVHGTMAMALSLAREANDTAPTLVMPHENGDEASVVPGVRIETASSLIQVCEDLRGDKPLPQHRAQTEATDTNHALFGDFVDVRGQQQVKRALEIAAAGQHSVLLIGPPGAGKSMLAQRLPSILPPMDDEEALDTGAISSLAGRFDPITWRSRPFRAPHHSASTAALIGGGQKLRPGEISLAHNGVLFLDELPEFAVRALDSLREPLETGRIALSRAARQLELPARFQLITAMNPCLCGYFGSERCRCTPDQIVRYQRRISGPLLDRLDLQQWVQPVPTQVLTDSAASEECSADISARVCTARARQCERQQMTNAHLPPNAINRYCALSRSAASLLHRTASSLQWSGRVFHRIQKIARTIADLADCADIEAAHVAEAINMRRALGLANTG